MLLYKLTLRQFRAHRETELNFSSGINLIHGPNGAGKTNVLEAIHYLCIGRSFIASKDSYALQFDQPFFDLKGEFEPEHRGSFDVRLVYKPDEGKRAFVNGAPLERLSDLVGRVPVVLFAPGDHALTDGPPDERRRFLDNTLSQAKPAYLAELLKFKRTMKQRNALLSRGRFADSALLQPWNEEFSRSASRITAFRADFISKFSNHMRDAFSLMEEISERPSIRYRPFAPLPDGAGPDEILDLHRSRLEDALPREKELKRSLVGPHRDELIFKLNDVEVRRFASQGQHRTFGMALKLAKFLYLKSRLDQTPILLLDDVFGDLDRHRSEVLLRLLEESSELGQSFITSAEDRTFRQTIDFDKNAHSTKLINKGAVVSSYA
ncbi:MAG: DNA replication/repair protein RecF [Candidatus Latescibacterota bacterium]|jgi:DNA replication and repair protein RecF